jgi:chaperonin cofactor prefoldin
MLCGPPYGIHAEDDTGPRVYTCPDCTKAEEREQLAAGPAWKPGGWFWSEGLTPRVELLEIQREKLQNQIGELEKRLNEHDDALGSLSDYATIVDRQGTQGRRLQGKEIRDLEAQVKALQANLEDATERPQDAGTLK